MHLAKCFAVGINDLTVLCASYVKRCHTAKAALTKLYILWGDEKQKAKVYSA
jgi:hypothetical protein